MKKGHLFCSRNGTFLEGLDQPVYPDVVQAARQDIQQTIQFLEDFIQKLHHSLQQVDGLEVQPEQKFCPFCGGCMFNLAPFSKLATSHDLCRYDPSFLDQFYRYSWECQSCMVYVTTTPRYNDSTWVRKDFAGKRSYALAARVFRQFPATKEVRCVRGSEWYILVGEDWYRFQGTAKEVTEQLGL